MSAVSFQLKIRRRRITTNEAFRHWQVKLNADRCDYKEQQCPILELIFHPYLTVSL